NGAALRTGDLYGSGTVSSFQRSGMGCLLELTAGGREPITLADGQTRGYLGDGESAQLCAAARAVPWRRAKAWRCAGRLPARMAPGSNSAARPAGSRPRLSGRPRLLAP